MAEELVVRFATEADIEAVKTLYDEVVELDRGTEYDVLWRRNLHPSDASLEDAVKAGQLVLVDPAAGGALMGVVSAILRFAGADWFLSGWNSVAAGASCSGAEAIAIIPLLLLIGYMIWASLKKD